MRGKSTAFKKLWVLVLSVAMLLNSMYLSAFAEETTGDQDDSTPAASQEQVTEDQDEAQSETQDDQGEPADTGDDQNTDGDTEGDVTNEGEDPEPADQNDPSEDNQDPAEEPENNDDGDNPVDDVTPADQEVEADDDQAEEEAAPAAKPAKAPAKAPSNGARAQVCSTRSDSDPYFDIYWLSGLNTTEVTRQDKQKHAVAIKDTPLADLGTDKNTQYVSSQVEFSIGRTGDPIEEDGIQIVLPRYLFDEWDWDGDGQVEKHDSQEAVVGVSKSPNKSGKGFWYYYAKLENGTYVEDEDGEYLVIANYESISNEYDTPITFTCMVNYPYAPSKVDETKTYHIKPEYVVRNSNYCYNRNNTDITAQVETGTYLASVTKSSANRGRPIETWNDTWGVFSDTGLSGSSTDYTYYVYSVSANVYGADYASTKEHGETQPYKLEIVTETPGADVTSGSNTYKGDNKGTVVGYSQWSTSSTFSTNSIHTKKYYEDSTSVDTTSGTGAPIGNAIGRYNNSSNIKSTNNIENSVAGSSSAYFSNNDTWKSFVVVAYPNDYVDKVKANPDEYKLTNKIEVKHTPYSSKDTPKTLEDSAYISVSEGGFRYNGHLFRVDKWTISSYTGEEGDTYKDKTEIIGGKWQLNDDLYVQTFRWHLSPYARGIALTQNNPTWASEGVIQASSNYDDYNKQPYVVELMDDQVYLNGVLLGPGDYEFTNAYYTGTYESFLDPDNDYEETSYSSAEPAKDTALVKLYARSQEGGEWTLVAEDVRNSDGTITRNVGRYSSNATKLPEGTIQVRMDFETMAYRIWPDMYVNMRIFPTEKVKSAMNEGEVEDQITNVASLGVSTTRNGQKTYWNLSDSDSMKGSGASAGVHDQSNYDLPEGKYFQHDWSHQWLEPLDIETRFAKDESGSNDDGDTQISTRNYSLVSNQKFFTYTDDPAGVLQKLDEVGIQHGQKEVTFYDLLPEGATVNVGSLKATYYERSDSVDNANNSFDSSFDSNSEVQGQIVSYSTVPNFNNSGRNLLIVHVAFPSGQDSEWGQRWNSNTELLQLGTRVKLDMQLIYAWDDLAFYADEDSATGNKIVRNWGAVQVPGSDDGYKDDPSGQDGNGNDTNVPESIQDALKDFHSVDGGEVTGYDTYYDDQVSAFNIATSSLTGFSKKVKAESESSFRNDSAVQAEESYAYRIRYSVDNDTQAKNIVLYDVLEHAFVDDAYLDRGGHREKYELQDRYWKGTFDRVDTSPAEGLGIDVKVYYSDLDSEELQINLDNYTGAGSSVSNYADVTNTAVWHPFTDDVDKTKVKALAFDCSKDTDGNPFVLTYDETGKSVVMVYVYMTAPDEDEVEKGWDDKGSYVDPDYIYAFNNAFLSAQSKSIGTPEYSAAGARMSDGTTVRISEPRPPIFKLEEDSDEKAGMTQASDATENDSIKLEDRNEVYKYTVTTKVPTLGVDMSGRDEKNTFTVYDTLVNELEFAKTNLVKIEIGRSTEDYYFVFDPEGQYGDDSSKGMLKEPDPDNPGEFIYTYFNSLSSAPSGFRYFINPTNSSGSSTSSSVTYRANTLGVTLSYDTSDANAYDRVNEFSGKKVTIEFYAKIREGASLGAYADGKVPNTAHYEIPNHLGNDSNTVYIEVEEETEKPHKSIEVVTGTDDDGNPILSTEKQTFYVVKAGTTENVLGEDGNPIIVTAKTDDDGNIIGYEDADGNAYPEEGQDVKTVQELENLTQKFQYTVTGQIPYEHSSLTISDTVEPVLEVDSSSIRVNFKGKVTVNELSGYSIAYDEDGTAKTKEIEIDKTYTLEELEFVTGRNYGLTFSGSSNGVSLNLDADFINRYGDYVLGGTIESTETENGTTMNIKQGDYGATYINAARDFALAGLDITITFMAGIKEGADLSAYMSETGTEIPNTANYRFGSNPQEKTEPVVVKPPREDIEKTVNNKTFEELASMNEVFYYNIDVKIPDVADDPETEDVTETDPVTSLVVYDTLEPVLEFYEVTAETLEAKITDKDGKIIYTLSTEEKEAGLTIDGQDIEFSLDKALDAVTDDEWDFENVITGEYRLAIKFNARIKEGISESELDKYREDTSAAEVPNTATYKINDKYEYKSNTVHVTPPSIGKTVNHVTDYYLSAIDEVFEYEITTHMPANEDETNPVTTFEITDSLVEALEFADTEEYPMSIKIGDTELTADEIEQLVTIGSVDEETGETINTQTITVTFGDGYVDNDDYKKHQITFTFYAKIKDGADLSRYWEQDGTFTGIPNTAAWVLNFEDGSSETERSKPVNVYPPEVGKSVNEVKHVDLADWDEEFTYKITTYMPVKTSQLKITTNDDGTETQEMEQLTKLIFSDTLEDVLTFVDKDDISFIIGGEAQDASKITIEEQTLSVDLLEFAEDHKGELVEISFKAKLKDGLEMADLADYVNETSESEVPNEAIVTLKFGDDPNVEDTVKKSEKVTVTPPPIEKKVNGKDHEDLDKHDEVFNYTIKTWVPVTDKQDEKATSFMILDTLVDELEFADVDGITVTIDGTEVDVDVSTEGQKLTVTLSEEQIEANPKKLVLVSFDAKIKEGADIAKYKTEDGIKIPNTSSYQINNDPEVESNTVTVTPPEVEKTVNDALSAVLEGLDEVFTYRISGMIPIVGEGRTATKFELFDELEDVLEFANEDDITIKLGGEENDTLEAVIEGQKISVTIDDADLLSENAGKYLVVEFDAKIKEGADLSEYVTVANDADIPNTAKLQIDIDNEPQEVKESKPVTVTPPPIEKKVNDKDHEALAKVDEVFEYSIKAIVPVSTDDDEITKFEIIDTLESVLEFADESATTVTIGDTKLTAAEISKQVTIKGQTITLTLTPEQIAEHGKEYVTFTFKANVKDGADLDAYIVDGLPEIPNTAKYVINDDPDRSKESKPVTVTPPTVDKKVNGETKEELMTRTEAFTYTVDTLIPNDAVKMTITDTLEDVLEFTEESATKVTIDGEEVTADIKTDGQKITAVIEGDALTGMTGKKLALEFKAKIRKGADLSKYKIKGVVEIPNVAQLNVNDDPDRNYETKPVTVTPPDPKDPPIEKKTNGKFFEENGAERERITYTIETAIPTEIDKFEIKDTLEDVLEFVDPDAIKITLDGEELSASEVKTILKVSGQNLSVTFDKDLVKANAEKVVEISFEAITKRGADLSPYRVEGHVSIPNTASYIINDDPSTAKDSNTVIVRIPGTPGENPPGTNPPTSNPPGRGPKTGDTTNIMMWILLLVLAGAMAGLIRARKKLADR